LLLILVVIKEMNAIKLVINGKHIYKKWQNKTNRLLIQVMLQYLASIKSKMLTICEITFSIIKLNTYINN